MSKFVRLFICFKNRASKVPSQRCGKSPLEMYVLDPPGDDEIVGLEIQVEPGEALQDVA